MPNYVLNFQIDKVDQHCKFNVTFTSLVVDSRTEDRFKFLRKNLTSSFYLFFIKVDMIKPVIGLVIIVFALIIYLFNAIKE